MTSLLHPVRPAVDPAGPPDTASRPDRSARRVRPLLTGLRGRLRYLRLLAWPVYLLALWHYVDVNGLPYQNDLVFCWLMGALSAAAVHSGHRFGWLRVLRDWVPVMGALYVYSLLRGFGAHTPWAVHYRPQLAFDRLIGFGQVWTVRLQHWLYTPGHPHWYDYACTVVYMSHFFAVFLVMAALWKRRHDRFTRLVALYLALTFAAFATYLLYPADPPWLTGQNGHIPQVTRIVSDVLTQSGMPRAGSIFENGSRFDNDVAAMPSLHAAYPMLLALFFWPTAGRELRVLLALYPPAMAFTLVYGAEHFVIDVLMGWLYAAVVAFGLGRVLDRRRERRERAKTGRAMAGPTSSKAGELHWSDRPARAVSTGSATGPTLPVGSRRSRASATSS